MSATTLGRDAEASTSKRQQRSRRQSLPSNLPSASRRLSGLAISDSSDAYSPSSSRPLSQAGAHVQFASPPYMPIYGATPSTSSSSSNPNRRSMPPLASSSSGVSLSLASPSRASRPGHVRSESSRLRRRLARWTSGLKSQDGLEFGCAGPTDWSEGPVDMSDRYYSPYRGAANRESFSSAGSTSAAGWSHSRGESTSSTFSVASTAPSSAPNSPTMRPDYKAAVIPAIATESPEAITPRTAERMRSEAAAIEAVDEYFRRMRVATPEVPQSRTGGFSFPQRPLSSAPTSIDVELARSTKSDHKRSLSDELEIQFIETGHTTYTPLSPSGLDDGQSSLILSYEDLSDDGDHSTYVPSEVTPIPPTLFEIPEEPSGSNSSTATARPSLAVPELLAIGGVEEDLVPALEELSDYFVSTLSVDAVERPIEAEPQPAVWVPVPIEPLSPRRRVAIKPGVPDLSNFAFPPKQAPPPSPSAHVTHARGGSTSSLPTVSTASISRAQSQGHRRGQSASFAAAERAKLVAAGQLKPSLAERYILQERNALYDWI